MGVQGPSRRQFHFTAFIYGIWGLITAALAVPAAVYLLVPPRGGQKEEWTEVGDIGQLAMNAPEEMVFRRRRRDGWKTITEKTTAWVSRVSENEVIAFAPQCTHLGCAYHWNDGKKNFICPCHTSAFAPDGRVLTGPAPRALDRYTVKVEGTKLFVGPVVEGEPVD
jgi:menaquinol-cytochrome c reductase iron-sulfur subunit